MAGAPAVIANARNGGIPAKNTPARRPTRVEMHQPPKPAPRRSAKAGLACPPPPPTHPHSFHPPPLPAPRPPPPPPPRRLVAEARVVLPAQPAAVRGMTGLSHRGAVVGAPV